MKFVRENVREMSGKNDSEKLCEPWARGLRLSLRLEAEARELEAIG